MESWQTAHPGPSGACVNVDVTNDHLHRSMAEAECCRSGSDTWAANKAYMVSGPSTATRHMTLSYLLIPLQNATFSVEGQIFFPAVCLLNKTGERICLICSSCDVFRPRVEVFLIILNDSSWATFEDLKKFLWWDFEAVFDSWLQLNKHSGRALSQRWDSTWSCSFMALGFSGDWVCKGKPFSLTCGLWAFWESSTAISSTPIMCKVEKTRKTVL